MLSCSATPGLPFLPNNSAKNSFFISLSYFHKHLCRHFQKSFKSHFKSCPLYISCVLLLPILSCSSSLLRWSWCPWSCSRAGHLTPLSVVCKPVEFNFRLAKFEGINSVLATISGSSITVPSSTQRLLYHSTISPCYVFSSPKSLPSYPFWSHKKFR